MSNSTKQFIINAINTGSSNSHIFELLHNQNIPVTYQIIRDIRVQQEEKFNDLFNCVFA